MAQDLTPYFTVITTLASAAVPSAALGVWIMRQFAAQTKSFYQALESQRLSFEAKVDDHERVDQGRHNDNLKEFRDISNSLTRLEYGAPRPKH